MRTWTFEKPTKPGWWWIRDDRRYGIACVRQSTAFDGEKFLWVDALYPSYGMNSGTMDLWPNTYEWLGPIDPPFLVTRLCAWGAGCSIPMRQEMDEPASLCLWHQACLRSVNPQGMALDQAQFDAWLLTLVAPVQAPWSRRAEVLWPVTLGKRAVELEVP